MMTSFLSHNRFAVGAKAALYVLTALLPVFFLPKPLGIDFSREAVFGILIIAAFILWLASLLASGEIHYRHSPMLYGAALMAAVFGVSALLSPSPWVSAFLADVPAERLSFIVLGLLLMAVCGSILRRREEGGTLVFILIFSGAVSALLTAAQFLFDRSLLRVLGAAGDMSANVIGTANGLALFYAALFMMTVGMLFSASAARWKGWVRYALGVAALLFLLDIFLINFRTAWIAILGASVFLFGLLLIDGVKTRDAAAPRFGMRHWGVAALVGVSIVMLMIRGQIVAGGAIPAEVSPSLNATLSIANVVFQEGPLKVFFGSGPGTFGLLWARHKDPSINQTIFWGVRFNQGQSWVSTLLPTAGVLGSGAFLLFLGSALFTFLRMLLSRRTPSPEKEEMIEDEETGMRLSAAGVGSDAFAKGVFMGFVSLLIGALMYPATLSFLLLLFLLGGVLTVIIALPRWEPTADQMPTEVSEEMTEETYDEISEDGLPTMKADAGDANGRGAGGFWSVQERMIRFAAPWSVFVSSLAIIFFISLGAAGIYGSLNHIRAALAATRGIEAANTGDIDGAIRELVRAGEIEPRDFRNLQALVQVRTEKVRRLIQRAAGGENVQQEFQTVVSAAVQDAQRLTVLYPQDPSMWRVQGALYEMLIPFIQGSERFATAAYQNASEREPANPEIYVEWGRAGLAFTDRIASVANQAQGKDREELLRARTQNLGEIMTIFQRAIRVKQDFAAAHFLLAQVALRMGNLDGAVQNVENAKTAAPFDIGVAFQLGLLYYQKNNFDRAQAEFERAVSINDNYSNARYFLGLIYDRKGNKQKAADQFDRIAKLNPDNDEVKHILVNLATGKSALDGIVPPAPPPEKRKEAPVREQERSP